MSRNRRHIWSLSDSNGIRTHSQLVRKRILNYLAKLSGCGFESRCCHQRFSYVFRGYRNRLLISYTSNWKATRDVWWTNYRRVPKFPFHFACEKSFTKEFYLAIMTKNSFLYFLERAEISDMTFAEVFDDS